MIGGYRMKLHYLLKSTLNQIQCRKGIFFLSTLLICTAFLVIGYQSIIVGSVYYQKNTVKDIVAERIENVYFINLLKYKQPTSEDASNLIRLMHDLSQIKGIKKAGLYTNEGFPDGIGLPKDIMISEDLISLCNLTDIYGNPITFSNEGSKKSVAVGYNLRDKYPLGYEFHDEAYGYDYIVTQIMEPGSRWLTRYDSFNELFISLDTVIAVEATPFLKADPFLTGGIASTFCYIVDQQADREQVEQNVKDLASSYDINIYSCVNIPERLKLNQKDLFEDSAIFYLAFGILALAIIAVVVSSMINIFLRKKSIGILYANGYTKKDMKSIFILENVIKIVISFLFAYGFWTINEKNINCADISIIQMMLPQLITGTVLLIVISSIFPLWQLRHLYPATLIGGKE